MVGVNIQRCRHSDIFGVNVQIHDCSKCTEKWTFRHGLESMYRGADIETWLGSRYRDADIQTWLESMYRDADIHTWLYVAMYGDEDVQAKLESNYKDADIQTGLESR